MAWAAVLGWQDAPSRPDGEDFNGIYNMLKALSVGFQAFKMAVCGGSRSLAGPKLNSHLDMMDLTVSRRRLSVAQSGRD